MKNEVKKTEKFSPVTLTIETEKEFKFLWHYINNSTGTPFEQYDSKCFNMSSRERSDIKFNLWRRINDINKNRFNFKLSEYD